MYGIEAISTNNGWAISVVGISIVFTGLVLLSMAIAQLHKILDLWENRRNITFSIKKTSPKESLFKPLSEKEKESARQFRMLVRTMDENFSLPRLLRLAEISGLERPHAGLARLVKYEIIIPDHTGYFIWDRDKFLKLLS